MRNDQQAFTVFGGAFVHENRHHEPTARSRRSAAPLAFVFAALILGTVTAGAAIQQIHAAGAFLQSNIFGMPQLVTALY
jgi:hypothetical protein